jgi:predicted DNA binding CopG/RHH family protein
MTQKKYTVNELKNFHYTGKTLAEMDQEDGSAETFDELIKRGIYEKNGILSDYEPVEYVDSRRERITMSIPSYNLTRLKMIANKKEIPYQTYINSLIKEHIDKESSLSR